MRAFLVVLLLTSASAHAQVYRWVDARGSVHYSNTPPPAGVRANKLDIQTDASTTAVPMPQSTRAEIRPENPAIEDRATPVEPKGLEFRKLVTLRKGMTEGEVLAIAGPPDAYNRDKYSERLTYLPTRADPFVTTIILRDGRVTEIEQARQF